MKSTSLLLIIAIVVISVGVLGIVMLRNSRKAACEALGGHISSSGRACISTDGRIIDIY